mmetsp:Transcript_29427/g.52681  ORF Transcript_29427/g.52681 Transcript_29427/m.52681 type:complete len:182 (-) Transcript_29427:1314-1859(-)
MWTQSSTVKAGVLNTHDYYRQHFEKLTKRSLNDSPLRKEILEPPSLASTLEKRATRIPWNSKAYSPVLARREDKWDGRFSVTFSKDNRHYPKALREYFDKPLDFSPESKDFSTCYGSSTSPIKSRASTVMSRRSKRSSTMTAWTLRNSQNEYEWRTISPVACQLNKQSHPLARRYFSPTRM